MSDFMNPKHDPWTRLADAWRREASEAASLNADEGDEAAPFGFAARVVARWKNPQNPLVPPRVLWLEIWETCAMRGACVAVVVLLASSALVLFKENAAGRNPASPASLIEVPDIGITDDLR